MGQINLTNLKTKAGETVAEPKNDEVNNHVHTTYSFSPYTPAGAAFHAWKAGLGAVGIMDHDSISGAEEIIEAAKILGIASTCGFEVRVNMYGTKLEGKKINNPDSENIAYMAVHGVPKNKFPLVEAFLAPICVERNKRNRKEVERLNELIRNFPIEQIDFDRDVLAISNAGIKGSITERHILYALAGKILDQFGKGEETVHFLEETMKIDLSPKIREFLRDESNPHYRYDLLGVMKSSFLPGFFIQPDHDECINVQLVVNFANSIGAIPAYAYLGDVTESATGDKKAEKFEDDYLDLLFDELKRIGFRAVTYMPPRNRKEQLKRVQKLCSEYGLMEISGVDINSSRQSFHCPEVLDPDFSHLIDATWALIAHEKLTDGDPDLNLFSKDNPLAGLSLDERIFRYGKAGRLLDPSDPVMTEKIREILN
ncbi:MAG: PHP domain-containing protein [Spirochaetales bacterium]|nr:PHP domain-containing protein [Spirochaetales bacterium]